MLKREAIIAELAKRIAEVEGMTFTARNPVTRPSVEDMPVGNIFDFPATVIKTSGGGRTKAPICEMVGEILLEIYTTGTTEATSSDELFVFVETVLQAIYTDGMSLGGLDCSLRIKEFTRVFRPPVGGNAAGIGIVFTVQYVEDLNIL